MENNMELNKKSISRQSVIITAILAVLSFLPFFPGFYRYITIAISALMLLLFFGDEFYLMIGVFMFFYEQLIFSAGNPAYRIFSYLLLIKVFFFQPKKIKLNVIFLPTFLIILLYCAFALINADVSVYVQQFLQRGQIPPSAFEINIRIVLTTIFDILFVYLIAHIVNGDTTLFEKICRIFIISAIISGLYGIFSGNTMGYFLGYSATGEIRVTRYRGTFPDPNYASFFYNMALFMLISLKNIFKNKYVRIILVFALYFLIIAAASITGFLCNLLALALYIIIKYKKKSPLILFVAAALISAIILSVIYIPPVRNLSIIKNIEIRIQNQYLEGDVSDIDALTSGRTRQWRLYWDYFKKQDSFKKAFGGNIVSTSNFDPYFAKNFKRMPHNAYLGFLLNFGVLGTIFIMGAWIIKNIMYFIRYKKEQNSALVAIILCNFIWFFYGAALDYFADWKFFFFYFL